MESFATFVPRYPIAKKIRSSSGAKEFGVSQTPMREALSRLVSRELVVAVGQRGFRVAPIGADDLADITMTRVALESAALRRSMRMGGGTWEGEIVSSLHQLKRIVGRSKVLRDSPDLNLVHKGFHASLIAGCGSPRMMDLAAQLYDQAFRYRTIMLATAMGAEDFVAEHEQLAEAVLSRSGNTAVAKLSAHLQRTYEDIYGKLPA
ncbi:FCD domain-containing protein [Bradyrhizobium sp. CSA207]|uniref:GntR family transcriptional regulator n=1 Tax=Bradyrhizobium sp. CSA207 TaxID=2698826 RepID=UPI0023AF868D|nr:FCD domain-containing protein [Bradyrhizobium sp. CSA207]MDE5444687.1 FCD domain-containing protein [Bradyrhizobium sp. CSA207]